MTLKYLLDTNVLSEPLRPQPRPQLLQRLQKYQDEIATASIVWHELLYGSQRLSHSKRRSAIEQYLLTVVLGTVPILPYDASAARWHAEERVRLTKIGRMPSFADGQIAATAAIHELTLVTANVGDFAGFRELEVVNWMM